MRYNALVVAVTLLAIGGLVAYGPVRGALGIGLDGSWQLALVYSQFALAPLLFFPKRGGRKDAADNLLAAGACWAAAWAVIGLFSFANMYDIGWRYGPLGACAWLAVTGVLALGARFEGRWVVRGRILLLCAFGLPALWSYLMLEYGGASGEQVGRLSPPWQLAVYDIHFQPLLTAGALAWVAALAVPGRRQA